MAVAWDSQHERDGCESQRRRGPEDPPVRGDPAAKRVDPLTGWTQSTDMNGQVRLSFETRDEAIAYAQRHGIAFQLFEPKEPKPIIKAYADNFASNRKQSWTH